MGELDDVVLFFSIEQKKEFLERHGYKIERVQIEKSISVYQNVFHDVLSAQDVAIKDGVQTELHATFEKELKQAILQL
ncbi:hypothetical protein [Sphingobacterium thalpophilum]|uniref:hypothetical protein n=1 Tax=Sphingobacterium thalpophilum TaxID=259 RepID=UPI0024A74B3B|nr:hypothetical protein [Sphingobacterium thalpophilum]